MKLNFSKSIRRFRIKSLPLLAGLILSPLAVMATDPIKTFTGTNIFIPGYSGNTISSPPQVDATTFVNSGQWLIYTYPYPYKTANTLNYTNKGDMYGWVGWEFDLGPSTTGQRNLSTNLSANFFNDNGRIIQAMDSSIYNPSSISAFDYLASYLWVSATNIVNKGHLIAGVSGEIRLNGKNVNLTRSTLEVAGIAGSARGSDNGTTNFMPDVAIYDEYWGQSGLTNDVSGIWDGTDASSTVVNIDVVDPCDLTNLPPRIFLTPPTMADSIEMVAGTTALIVTNIDKSMTVIEDVPTNIFRQVVFIGVGDPNIIASNRFLSSGNPTNLYRCATVQLTNSVSGEALYIIDVLAADVGPFSALSLISLTNAGVLQNDDGKAVFSDPVNPCTGRRYRPGNYVLSRIDLGTFADGVPGDGSPAFDFLSIPPEPGVPFPWGQYGDYAGDNYSSNTFVAGDAAAYEAYVDNLAYDPYGDGLTNLPGRIVINADNLDLTRAILTNGGAEITIQAGHLISSTGAVVSCQNLSYNLGSTNGHLNITNLVSGSALPGFRGYVRVWSYVWTNTFIQVITDPMNYIFVNVPNPTPPPDELEIPVESPLTNVVQMQFRVLLVDASGGLFSTVPELVQDLILHSTNMIVSDPITVVRTLLFDGQSLNLVTNLTLTNNLQNWTYTNAPTLRYFTNNGTLIIPMDAHFGDDGPINYAAFVNNGTINAASETVDSDYYRNGGSDTVGGGFFVTTSNGLVENASISSGQNVDFTGGTLELTNATITAGNHLYFNLTNKFGDLGYSSGNALTCFNGFSLLSKPLTGNLLGTTISSVRWDGAAVDHFWAGADLGDTDAGFTNNVAIGTLVLTDLGIPASLYEEPLFVLSGASTTPGVTNGLYVDNLDLTGLVDSDNEIQVNPNLIIYYKNVIGAIPVPYASRFVHATTASLPGPYAHPSNPSPRLSANVVGSGNQFQLTVHGVTNQAYIVEASTNLSSTNINWVPVFTNTTPPTNGQFQFIEPTNGSHYPIRFYRVVKP